MRILIVEDHKKINALLARFARQDKHTVKQTYHAEEALELMSKESFDMMITDLMLGDMQGEELIQRIRSVSDIYIMVISAKTELSDKLDVLGMGADDYLTKPFSIEEVMAKLANIEKRLITKRPLFYSFYQGELIVRPLERMATYKNENLDFTVNEFDVLAYLMQHPNRVFSRMELLDILFQESEAYDRIIDVYIKNIRKKLHDQPKQPRYIKTVFGLGYQFVGDLDD